jgi:hypothetical protein
MAYSWARKGETPRNIAFHFTLLNDAIDLRAAKPGETGERVFTPDELPDLWLTLQKSGFNLKSAHVMLTGKEKDENGIFVRIAPEITVEREGKTRDYAYTSKQLEAFGTPKNLHLMSGYKGAPLLIVGQMPYEQSARGSRRETPTVTRMTAAPTQAPSPQGPSVSRRRA